MKVIFNERETLKNNNGCLEICGLNCSEIAERYGTPLYLMDKMHIENMCKTYVDSLSEFYGFGAISYASKAFCCKEIYRIIKQFSLYSDIVSAGECYTAIEAGFDPEKLIFHGNNKLYYELEYAIKNNVGIIVVDSDCELNMVQNLAEMYNKNQKVLLRVNPGVEAHTHKFIQTANIDSKFGFPVNNEITTKTILSAKNFKNISLVGLHCHIGSQIFKKEPFIIALDKMTSYYKYLKDNYGIVFNTLDLGGGFGIYYNRKDPLISFKFYKDMIKFISDKLKKDVKCKNIGKQFLILEPGRSIVGEAGITLYKIGSIKKIENCKNYINVDGGMFENPRHILYDAKYTVLPINRLDEKANVKYTIAGKCCESGDIIAENVYLPEMKKDEFIAVLSTGAYNYSMASNYNRNFIPPVVFVEKNNTYIAVKKQDFKDIIRNDI